MKKDVGNKGKSSMYLHEEYLKYIIYFNTTIILLKYKKIIFQIMILK